MKGIITICFIGLSFLGSSQPNIEGMIHCSLQNIEELMLIYNPLIKQSFLDIERSQADLLSSQSTFDNHVFADASYSRERINILERDPRWSTFKNIRSNNSQIRAGIQKHFRNSLQLNSNVQLNRNSNSFIEDEFGNLQNPFLATNAPQVTLQLLQPLMKGKGRTIVTANEKASELQIEANKIILFQHASEVLLNIHLSYWDYLASQKIYDVYLQNEARVLKVLNITQTLVVADKKPASDLVQVQADLADKEGQTIIANQALFQAKQNLARAIGLGIQEANLLGDPVEDFPIYFQVSEVSEDNLTIHLQKAIENRRDLKALELTQAAMSIYLDQAENSLLPQFDVGAFINYSGKKIGNNPLNLISAWGEKQGSHIMTGLDLSYVFPLQNSKSKASFAWQKIAFQEQQITIENEQRNIKLNVGIALNNLRQSKLALEKTQSALDFYQLAFENEQQKFQNGLTTLINLILFQERLTFVQINYVKAQQQFANDYSTLRFETGDLLSKASIERLE